MTMADVGVEDVAVGQRWFHSVTQKKDRIEWEVESIDGDKIRLRHGDTTMSTAMGSLLAHWSLIREAE